MKNILAMVALLVLSLVSWPQIVIETRQGGSNFSCYQELSGNWEDSIDKSYASGVTGTIGSRFVNLRQSTRQATARFMPEIPRPGGYDVYVTWGRSSNCRNACYKVVHRDGEKVVHLDQDGWGGQRTSNSNRWVALGSFYFNAGRQGFLETSDKDHEGACDEIQNPRLYADAVMFVCREPGSGTEHFIPSPVIYPKTPAPGTPTPPSPSPVRITPTPLARASPIALPTTLTWITDLRQGLLQAATQQKRVLLWFYHPLVPRCRQMEEQLQKNQEALRVLNQYFVCVKVDGQLSPELVSNYYVYRVPAVVCLDAKGTVIFEALFLSTVEELVRSLRTQLNLR